jgi:hypothetical protein
LNKVSKRLTAHKPIEAARKIMGILHDQGVPIIYACGEAGLKRGRGPLAKRATARKTLVLLIRKRNRKGEMIMSATSKNGSKAPVDGEAIPGINLGSGIRRNPNALSISTGVSPGGALSSATPLSLPQVLGHPLTREEQRIVEQTEAQALAIQGQAAKLRVILNEWNNMNQQVGVNTAQTFALLTALKHLSSDPDYQTWWASWAKFQAERCVNTTDDLLVVGARVMAEVLAQPVNAPGELVALWRSLFAR